MSTTDLLTELTLDEKISLLAGESVWGLKGVARVGLAPIRVMDGPVGVRSTPSAQGGTAGPSTNFPAVVCMSASLRPDLMEAVGRALGCEIRAKGFHVLLAPCINLHRVPIGGRNFESFSEDPYWTISMAIPYINGVQREGIGTSLKHFAVNNQEHERMTISAEVDERTLREVYLSTFEQVIKEANPWTVMGAYNKLNGTHACENRRLLTTILREEWGYEGVVVSDWGAVHSGVFTVRAGCNIEMPGPGKFLTEGLRQAIETGDLTETEIDALVKPVLELYRKCATGTGGREANTAAHQTLSRRVAEEGMVLLKNDNQVLPFDLAAIQAGKKKLAVLGPLANLPAAGGGGSSLVDPPYHVTALAGLREAVGEGVELLVEPGCSIMGSDGPLVASCLSVEVDGTRVQGLRVDYFNNVDCAGQPVVSEHEPQLQPLYFFGNRAPREGVCDDGYSIRWAGTYTPAASGDYYFMLTTDEKGRLRVGDQVVIDNWEHPEINIPKQGCMRLRAGECYCFELCFAKTNGFGGIRLLASAPQEECHFDRAVASAAEADAAVVFVGLNDNYEREGADRESFSLPEGQDALILAVAAVNPNTVVALYNGTPVDMLPWVDQVAGILECWYPGQENGRAVANILFGKVSPSGKLPSTFPRRLADASCAADYPGTDGEIHFSEGVFGGHRHFEKCGIDPLFPLGHGLSYTTFEYRDLVVSKGEGATVAATCTVTNTGDRAGAEGVQLYVSDLVASVERPLKELKGLQKVFLQPGESRPVQFKLVERDFSFYDVGLAEWTWEPGEFALQVGASSADIRLRAVLML